MNHTNGVGDEIDTFIGTTTTDCPATYEEADFFALPSSMPTGGIFITNHPSRVVTVTAGTYTFYVNTTQFGGGSTNAFAHGAIQAVFYPN